jgi:CubicO group peptidase (beta-lactamase class C family)
VSQSIAKSILSILVGAAVDQGLLRNVDDPVTAYLPELAGTGYSGVSIKQVLQMATGVGYSEDYRDSTSGAATIGAALITGKPSFADFVRSMQPTEVAPGTAFQYQSVNSQLLGLLLENVTGTSLSRWAERTLWSRLGAESDATFYQARGQPDTCAFACFNATLRDYGRVGLLMLGHGAIGGRRVVSEDWVRQSITPDADFQRPVPAGVSEGPRTGYGYQWWIPPGSDGAFMAVGIFGQAIYVNPARRIVVVQTAAWPTPIGGEGLGAERTAVFDAIAGQLGVP